MILKIYISNLLSITLYAINVFKIKPSFVSILYKYSAVLFTKVKKTLLSLSNRCCFSIFISNST